MWVQGLDIKYPAVTGDLTDLNADDLRTWDDKVSTLPLDPATALDVLYELKSTAL